MNTNLFRQVCGLVLFISLLTLPRPALAQKTKLKIRIFPTVVTGVRPGDAKAFTRPMVRRLARDIFRDREAIDFGLAQDDHPNDPKFGDRADDLMKFGKQLDKGEIHIGVVWGLEYGWLRRKFPRLRPLVVGSQGVGGEEKISWPIFLYANPKHAESAKDLKQGKILATYPRAPFQDMLFLKKLLKEQGRELANPYKFFKLKPCATPKAAVRAVLRGDAHYVVVSAVVYLNLSKKWRTLKLKDGESERIPEPVLIGRVDVVNKLRSKHPTLWNELQEKLQVIHKTAAGEEFAEFWNLKAFVSPKRENLDELVNNRLKKYSFQMFTELSKERIKHEDRAEQ